MTTFAIDCDNDITAFGSQNQAKAADIAAAEYFGSQEELAKLAAAWPGSRLVEIWNSLPGVAPLKKFTDRKTAVARIWKAAQALTPAVAPQGAPGASKAATSTKKASRGRKAATAREGSKKAQIISMLQQPNGATLGALIDLTGWQPHSVRGFLSGGLSKKMGLNVQAFKREGGERAYRIAR